MPSDSHWATIETAKSLVRQHGSAAESVAMSRVAEGAAQADRVQIAVWTDVADAIRKGFATVKSGE